MRTSSPIAVLVTFVSLLLIASGAVGAADTSKGWVLEHFNPHTGRWNVYLSKKGVALVNPRMECTVVSKSPAWNVVVYNDKTKVYFTSPLKDLHFQEQLKSASLGENLSHTSTNLADKPPRKIKDVSVCGRKSAVYITDNVAQTGMKKFEFWVTKDIQAPEQFKVLFEKMFQVNMANIKGYPLKVAYVDENGKHTPVLDIKGIKQDAVVMSSFDYPQSYKRVDSEFAVFMDEKGREAMDTIMNDLGEGEGDDEVAKLLESDKKTSAPVSGETSSESTEEEYSSDDSNDWILFAGIGMAVASVLGGFAWFFFRSGQPKK